MFIEPLDNRHDKNSFDCDEPELNSFLKKHAGQQQRKYVGKTFVAVQNKGQTGILGYYTISAGSVQFQDFPPSIQKKLPKYPVPIARLGRLAVDKTMKGKGLGKALLKDALMRAANVAVKDLGVAAVVVDAKNDEAAKFYLNLGFQTFDENPNCLFIMTKTILDSL